MWKHILRSQNFRNVKGNENKIRRIAKKQSKKRISYKERMEDALVHGAEEGRDKLRKATGRSKYPEIRRYPNEGTQHG